MWIGRADRRVEKVFTNCGLARCSQASPVKAGRGLRTFSRSQALRGNVGRDARRPEVSGRPRFDKAGVGEQKGLARVIEAAGSCLSLPCFVGKRRFMGRGSEGWSCLTAGEGGAERQKARRSEPFVLGHVDKPLLRKRQNGLWAPRKTR